MTRIRMFGLGFIAAAMVSMLGTGCTRVETGEVGMRKTFTGVIEMTPLMNGFHQVMIGDVIIFSAKEIMIPLQNMTPSTADKMVMKDVDVSFTYSVVPEAIGELYTKYGVSSHIFTDHHSEIYVMGNFVTFLVTSAVNDEIATHNALDVANQRDAIVIGIQDRIARKLAKEGLEKKVRISQVVLSKTEIPSALADSANLQATAQNQLNAAQKEADRIKAIALTTTKGYVDLLNAQAKVELAKNCGKTTIWVVPDSFTSLGNISTGSK